MMFLAIIKHELVAWYKKPGFYFLTVLFFLLPLFLFVGTGGYFDGGVYEENETLIIINSPLQVHLFLQYIGKFLLFLLPAIIGTTLYRDFQFDVFKLFYSYPVGKGIYLSAKFISSLILVLFISLMPFFAFITGEVLLGPDNPNITGTNPTGYMFSYGLILLPNLLVFGVLVFCTVALFRNIYAGFFLILLLIIFQLSIENLFHASSFLMNFLDPFGQNASLEQTRYWSLNEKNTRLLQTSQILLLNRSLWMLIGLGVGFFTYRKFTMSQFGWDITEPYKRRNKSVSAANASSAERLMNLQIDTGLKQVLLQFYTLIRHQVVFILSHRMFHIFTLMGVMLLVLMLNRVLHSEEIVMLPLTRLVLQVPSLFYNLLVVFATFIFSGMIVLRERDSGMDPLIYSTLTPTSIIVVSKAFSLILIQQILLLLLMATGITMQYVNGYTNFDFPQYFLSLFLFQAPVLAVWALLSVFVFSITRHLYVGLFILLMAWLAQFGYEQLGITTKLLQFNTYSLPIYSDINGYGHAFMGRLVLQAYWLLWGFILLFIAFLFWPRVQTKSLKEKWVLLIGPGTSRRWILFGFLIIPLIYISITISKAENETFNINENQQIVEVFQSKYSELKDLPQPRITSVSLNVDLHPEKNVFNINGEYSLVNMTNMPVDTIMIKTSVDEITVYQIAIASQKVDSFPEFNFTVYQLEKALMPGETVSFKFKVNNRNNTLLQKNSGVLTNGTFLTQDILPRIGYFLNQDKQIHIDTYSSDNHYQAWDSDLVSYNATVSTSGNQVAFSNGKLIDHWQEKGRNFYSYQTSEPVKFNFYFNSGDYNEYREKWNNIPITTYHHPDHTLNLEEISVGVKSAISFNHQLFGYAPNEEIRIIEYPISEGSFSTIKSNSIVMSESVFGVNTEQPDRINFPFYIAAHEMTHHWFANKLLPRDARGALFLSESITEYLTLQIFKETFGETKALEFLKIQHERYFRGRANTSKEETPLYKVEAGKEYIYYGKGSVALNAISQTVGTEKFYKFLSDFFIKYHGSDRYPTSMDFIEMLTDITPDNSQQLVKDFLMKSVIHDNEIINAKLQQTGQQEWSLKVDYNIQTFEQGEQVTIDYQKLIELGIYDATGDLITIIPVSATNRQIEIKLSTPSKPERLFLDPYYLTLDRNRSNNEFIINNQFVQ